MIFLWKSPSYCKILLDVQGLPLFRRQNNELGVQYKSKREE